MSAVECRMSKINLERQEKMETVSEVLNDTTSKIQKSFDALKAQFAGLRTGKASTAMVDGIYTADPKKDPQAKKYGSLRYETALEKRLKVMDAAAFALCMDNEIPIVVFDFFDGNALLRVVRGEAVGTLVSEKG